MRQTLTQTSISKMSSNESQLLMNAHTFANLFKAELNSNFASFSTTTAWDACKATGVQPKDYIYNYLWALKDPGGVDPDNTVYRASAPAGCLAKTFATAFFRTMGPSPVQVVPLQNLQTVKLEPIEQINRLDTELQVADFNTDPTRNLIIAKLRITTHLPIGSTVTKEVRVMIDLRRTVASAPDASCHLCRTVPGAVCCGGNLKLTYLESGAGRIMDLDCDVQNKLTKVDEHMPAAAYPTAISVKNVDGSPSATVYSNQGFCVPEIQTDPVLYITDAATVPSSGERYHLTTHGYIIRNGDMNTPVAIDPKLESIAYDNSGTMGPWFLLRSDGAVLHTADITNPSSYLPIEGCVVPTATKLTVGVGSTPCP